jgi:hypothetical protein
VANTAYRRDKLNFTFSANRIPWKHFYKSERAGISLLQKLSSLQDMLNALESP